MNGDGEHSITVEIEGLESTRGNLRLDVFLEYLSHLLTTLNEFDRLESGTGNPTLYYEITHTKNHPLTFTFEPYLRPTARAVTPEQIQKTHTRFFRDLTAIRRNEAPPDVDEYTLEHLHDFASGLGREFKAATISNHVAKVDVDEQFEQSVRRLVNEEDASYGGVEGTLEALNIHGSTRRFWIYPKIGPQRVRCDFLPGTQKQIREALGHYVRVEGLKHFRPNSPFPYRVNVREFEIFEDATAENLSQSLAGSAPNATGDLSSVDFVRAIRDEWP